MYEGSGDKGDDNQYLNMTGDGDGDNYVQTDVVEITEL
jgi:hypothetical protein